VRSQSRSGTRPERARPPQRRVCGSRAAGTMESDRIEHVAGPPGEPPPMDTVPRGPARTHGR
jgi:hypothetical protein